MSSQALLWYLTHMTTSSFTVSSVGLLYSTSADSALLRNWSWAGSPFFSLCALPRTILYIRLTSITSIPPTANFSLQTRPLFWASESQIQLPDYHQWGLESWHDDNSDFFFWELTIYIPWSFFYIHTLFKKCWFLWAPSILDINSLLKIAKL